MKLNNQAVEKLSRNPDLLSVHSIFHTIQGEGPFSGHGAVFVRLAGCNLQCPLCDTEYTEGRKNMAPDEIFDRVIDHIDGTSTHLVVITGGEPFRQDIDKLVGMLIYNDILVQVETNGTFAPSIDTDALDYFNPHYRRPAVTIVVSPKTNRVHEATDRCADAYKYILKAGEICGDDGLPLRALDNHTKGKVARRNPKYKPVPIYIQPCDEQDAELNRANNAACVASGMKHGYIVQVQAHKHLGVE